MYLKKLELIGFKSFLDKTTLHFEPGITAVVGPNGVGKSNIFDSMRWVLGEQSVKSLRGSDMQDVIFNGTDSKEPLGMAEVSLTFDNEKKYFNLEHEEVTITRRIFRSGESEYLLNKTLVRLKDILDLLAGTGIGAENYSLVEQGKIGMILSSRPEDRRMVFDEASGITRYKTQKREAMRKLEETQQNLLRVTDIIAEVKRQIASLERQANKARRYKEVFEELKIKEIDAAVLQRAQLTKEKDEIIRQLKELESEESGLLAVIKEEEAKINNRQLELKALEDNMMAAKNQILNLDTEAIRSKERLSFNKEKIIELEGSGRYFKNQLEQTKSKLLADEEKLNKSRQDYNNIHKDIEERNVVLKEKESELEHLSSSIKSSLDNITKAKKNILELAIEASRVNNNISDILAKEQTFLARLRRLELEKTKLHEEYVMTEEELNKATQELNEIEKVSEGLTLKISGIKEESDAENEALNNISSQLEDLGRQRLTLESHREFIEKLKTKYEDISESLNAVIQLDKLAGQDLSGLVVKIKKVEDNGLKLSGEAKPIDLDTTKISEKIKRIEEQLDSLKNTKVLKEGRIQELNGSIRGLEQELRAQEINLANKNTQHQNISSQFQKIKEEDEIIALELSDVKKELDILAEKSAGLKTALSQLQKEQSQTEELIVHEQNSITLNTELKEKVIIVTTQVKTELDSLNKRINSDEAAVKMLEDVYKQDKEGVENFQQQIKENETKIEGLSLEIVELQRKIEEITGVIKEQNIIAKEADDKYRSFSEGATDVMKKIDSDRKKLDALKNNLYELQMHNKDIDFKYQGIKERMSQSYKIELENIEANPQAREDGALTQEIEQLKQKLDSLGNVNLVAIEEYDELKKRYDFLIQQESDLNTARESLHQAILKINRTTKQMFLETFEKVREEFRNYFRLLFNGGDAQIFLIDEQDPLESGIEIICRPPGKKLQNVLLLSGGEKSLSAIALIFAIFKIKPSPFCVLDEIDAALDEANVDRFGRLLQEFASTSQFIVITHNKKTIANASVMYGITMEQSGVSKIVSVKFSEKKVVKDKELTVAAVEAA